MSDSRSERNPVEELAEEFLGRYRRGEQPDVAEYTARYPALAQQIRDLFPALVMMEEVQPGEEDTLSGTPGSAAVPRLQRLGDFRILREVGHGGMGVVYEAEQESLGRHVALKVLLTHSLLDPKQLQRFHREARAAARLHHTNIVPVYGVGESEGLHYYIMQFIQGQGLDQVLAELRRLERLRSPATRKTVAESASMGLPADVHITAVVKALLTGRFSLSEVEAVTRTVEATPSPRVPPGQVLEGSEPERRPQPPRLTAPADTEKEASSSATIHLPGQSEHSTLSHSSNQYFQSVARIGVQVADALAYAHGQGILHRDIKPSNLLLDTMGTVWVTDFGLAKALGDQDDLTHTGDIVGTLRYMAPERFSGKGDVRSDVYSLGLTLYELVTLRPAFAETNRNKLIQEVIHEEPPRPRKFNAAVPRDLETVILKATARDPGQRYQAPAALAEDLKRFLEDRPIRARRANVRERLWRWCRRNPALAALTATVQVALLGLLVLGGWSYVRISQALTDTESQRKMALQARTEAMSKRDEAVKQAYHALLNETRALRLAHTQGWRYQASQKLKEIAQLDTPSLDIVDLRNEAIACLGALDAQEEVQLRAHTQSVWSIDFSRDGSFLATAGYDGRTCLWDVKQHRLVSEVHDPGLNLAMRHNSLSPLPAVRIRPDGSYLAYAAWNRTVGRSSLAAGKGPVAELPLPAATRYLAFDSAGRLLAVSRSDGDISLFDAAAGTLKKEIRTKGGRADYVPVALSPDGELLAAMGPSYEVQLHFLNEERETVSLGHHRLTVRSLCFSPRGDLLASASEDHTVKLWNVLKTNEDPLTLLGHTARVHCVAFSPRGNWLASVSDDETVRLWDTRTGEALMTIRPNFGPVLSVAFSPDGSRLAVGTAAANSCPVCVYQLTTRQVKRQLAGHRYTINDVVFHPNRPLLASASSDGTVIQWDLRTEQQRQRWPGVTHHGAHQIALAPAGDLLAVGLSGFNTNLGKDYGVYLLDGETGQAKRRLAGPRSTVNALKFDASGKWLAAGTQTRTVFLFQVASGRMVQKWDHPGPVVGLGFLKKGKQLVVLGSTGQLRLRDQTSGSMQPIGQEEVPGGPTCLAIAPDEDCLAVGSADGSLRIYSLPALKHQATLSKGHADPVRTVAFSPDGSLLASGGMDRQVVLWDWRGKRRLASLPHNTEVRGIAFDPTGARLAACGIEELITVWDLGQIRTELAAVGLDWGAPRPPVPLQPAVLAQAEPPPPVKTVQAPPMPFTPAGGIPQGPAPVITVLPPATPRARAKPEELAGWIKQLGSDDGKVRKAAAQALVGQGAHARAALEAAYSADFASRKQIQDVLDQIAIAQAIAPTRIRLQLKNVQPADAIHALVAQSGLPLVYMPTPTGPSPRPITLNLEDVPVWDALDRICAAGGLSYLPTSFQPTATTIQVTNQARLSAVACNAGPFHVHVLGGVFSRGFTFLANNLQTFEDVQLRLMVLQEPGARLLAANNVLRLNEARTQSGQSLLTPQPFFPLSPGTGVVARNFYVYLKASDQPKDKLEVLKGLLTMDLMAQAEQLITLNDVTAAGGQTVSGPLGHHVTILSSGRVGSYWTVTVRLMGPLAPEGARLPFGQGAKAVGRDQRSGAALNLGASGSGKPREHLAELADGKGNSSRMSLQRFTTTRRRVAQPEDLAWLAAAPVDFGLSGLFWPALAVNPPGLQRGAWTATLRLFSPPTLQGPVSLRIFRFERLRAEVPFELRDIPLP
jgi:WD40 repeat protein/serine/threonine protein kinase